MCQLKHQFTNGRCLAPVNSTEICGPCSTSLTSFEPCFCLPCWARWRCVRFKTASRFRDATSRCSSCGRNSVKTPGGTCGGTCGAETAGLFWTFYTFCFNPFHTFSNGFSKGYQEKVYAWIMRRFSVIWPFTCRRSDLGHSWFSFRGRLIFQGMFQHFVSRVLAAGFLNSMAPQCSAVTMMASWVEVPTLQWSSVSESPRPGPGASGASGASGALKDRSGNIWQYMAIWIQCECVNG